MRAHTSVFRRGSSTMRRDDPLPEGNSTYLAAAKELRDCRTHSRRVDALLDRCWAALLADAEEDADLSGEAECLLAAVDAAASAARAMLTGMGRSADVERWERRDNPVDAAPRKTVRGANARGRAQ